MHHLFVTPLVAGVVTAGIIVLSPSFSDPYEAAYASEEPVVQPVEPVFSQNITAPLEVPMPEFPRTADDGFAPVAPQRFASLLVSNPDVLSDVTYTRSDVLQSSNRVSALGSITKSVKPPRAKQSLEKVQSMRAEMPLLEVSVSRMNLRAGPGTTFKKLGQLQGGTLLEQTGEAQGPWLEIAVLETGKTGWLHSKYLSEIE